MFRGKSTLDVIESTIVGNVTVNNALAGSGDSLTRIQSRSHLQGNLTVTNLNGNDKIILHDTDVYGVVDIDNGDGHTNIDVERTDVGLGVALGGGTSFEVDNDSGTDVFRMVRSTVKDDLNIDNSDNAADAYGSTTTITDSRIGDALFFDGDNGLDNVTLTNTVVVDLTDLDLFAGSNNVVLSGGRSGGNLVIGSGAGVDKVRLTNHTVEGDTDIDLGAGVDLLEILAASQLLGQSSLAGGGGIDTLWRQLTPTSQRVNIAFLAYEDFEIEKSMDLDPYPFP